MISKQVEREFYSIMEDVLCDGEDLCLADKYLDIDSQFKKAVKGVRLLQKKNLNYGVDFGCGAAPLSVLAHILGKKAIALDTVYRSTGEINPFVKVLERIKAYGVTVELFDTTQEDWKWDKNEFEFVSSLSSIISGCPPFNNLKYCLGTKIFKHRFYEMARIIKPGGFMIVGGRERFKLVMGSRYCQKLLDLNEIKSLKWTV